jgi:hypothetical protein
MAHTSHRQVQRTAVFLVSDCPACYHRLNAAYGVAARSAPPSIDPAAAPNGSGACEKDEHT